MPVDLSGIKEYSPSLATTAGLVDSTIGFQFGSRFPKAMGSESNVKQVDDWCMRVTRTPLPAFDPQTEEELENWADSLAQAVRVKVHEMNEEALIGLVIKELPEQVRQAAQFFPRICTLDIEAFITALALELFPNSHYVGDHFVYMLQASQEDLSTLCSTLQKNLSRYVRLATRWQFNQCFTRALLPSRVFRLLAARRAVESEDGKVDLSYFVLFKRIEIFLHARRVEHLEFTQFTVPVWKMALTHR